MPEKDRLIDHGNRHLKLMLRRAMLSLVEPHTALDVFAGRGEIACALYQGFKELHCVEKNPRKFLQLEKNLSFISGPRIHAHKMDNLVFLETGASAIGDVNLLDFDAYGMPNLQIKSFFANCRLVQPTLVFVTDGGRMACMRGKRWSPGLYSSRTDSNLSGAGLSDVLVRQYERLILQFWHEMSQAYQFRMDAFKIFWKKRKQVAYYGLLISPR